MRNKLARARTPLCLFCFAESRPVFLDQVVDIDAVRFRQRCAFHEENIFGVELRATREVIGARDHGVIDDDSPIILFPSAPHDFLFTKRDEDGTRGWISKTKQLTLTEVNRVLTEAMSFCGANFATRELVFYAVELANEGIRDEFAH